jgi:predicted nucleotidyltransferase
LGWRMMAHSKEDNKLKEIVSRLKAEFNPQKLILFGSRAHGTPRADSDYDFVLVTRETDRSRVDNMIRASELFKDMPISLDVFVYPEGEFLDWKNEFNSIPEIASTLGREINLADF